mmetsp:Transcript_21735/g.84761  ORF Transcript_21735/g.84761 Transcript_21735/m.84761 type:complete len:230 (-) Transcript_21735:125-814(-)
MHGLRVVSNESELDLEVPVRELDQVVARVRSPVAAVVAALRCSEVHLEAVNCVTGLLHVLDEDQCVGVVLEHGNCGEVGPVRWLIANLDVSAKVVLLVLLAVDPELLRLTLALLVGPLNAKGNVNLAVLHRGEVGLLGRAGDAGLVHGERSGRHAESGEQRHGHGLRLGNDVLLCVIIATEAEACEAIGDVATGNLGYLVVHSVAEIEPRAGKSEVVVRFLEQHSSVWK